MVAAPSVAEPLTNERRRSSHERNTTRSKALTSPTAVSGAERSEPKEDSDADADADAEEREEVKEDDEEDAEAAIEAASASALIA